MMWVQFQLAAEEVERRLGLSWGMAQKTLLEACENEEVTWQKASQGGPDVLDTSLLEWLKAKQNPPARGGKQPLILRHLAMMFHDKRVPDPSDCSRKALRADLIKRDRRLDPLDFATLKTAIDKYNTTH
jgi:hypothetical protein